MDRFPTIAVLGGQANCDQLARRWAQAGYPSSLVREQSTAIEAAAKISEQVRGSQQDRR
jgi:hypothetical protein